MVKATAKKYEKFWDLEVRMKQQHLLKKVQLTCRSNGSETATYKDTSLYTGHQEQRRWVTTTPNTTLVSSREGSGLIIFMNPDIWYKVSNS
eukprot:12945275-Ditylum_brightwellii.AAC.1